MLHFLDCASAKYGIADSEKDCARLWAPMGEGAFYPRKAEMARFAENPGGGALVGRRLYAKPDLCLTGTDVIPDKTKRGEGLKIARHTIPEVAIRHPRNPEQEESRCI